LFGEVELRVVSAAAAVSWELRFFGRHQGRQRCCQENAECCVGLPDETGSQGTSADVEVAVVNSLSVCGERRRGASVHRDETGNWDRRPASGSLPTLSSWERLESGEPAGAQSGDVAVADAINERGTSAGRSSRSSSRVNGDVRPTGILVRRITNVRGRSTEGDPPPGPFGA